MPLTQKSFLDLIAYSRAGAAPRFNAMGLLEFIEAAAPRFDHDPVNHLPFGLLLDPQRTNTFLNSGNLSLISLNANAIADEVPVMALDGQLSARVIHMTGAAASGVYRTTAANSASQQVWSVFAHSIAGNGLIRVQLGGAAYATTRSIDVDLLTGKITAVSGATGYITPISADGWYRVEITAPVDNAATPVHNVTVYSGDTTTKSIALWGGQVETGKRASSYIPTTTAQVTRPGDTGVLPTVSPWFNPLQGTIFVDCINRLPADGGTFGISLGSDTKNYIGMAYTSPSGPAKTVYVRTNNDGPSLGGTGLATTLRQALAWDATGLALSNNGEAVTTSALPVGGMPPVSSLRIGNSHFSSQVAPMHLRAIRYYPHRLTNAELQALTA